MHGRPRFSPQYFRSSAYDKATMWVLRYCWKIAEWTLNCYKTPNNRHQLKSKCGWNLHLRTSCGKGPTWFFSSFFSFTSYKHQSTKNENGRGTRESCPIHHKIKNKKIIICVDIRFGKRNSWFKKMSPLKDLFTGFGSLDHDIFHVHIGVKKSTAFVVRLSLCVLLFILW